MTVLFAMSYALLFGLLVLEGLVFREVLRKSVAFKRSRINLRRKDRRLASGEPAPRFSARILGSKELLTTSHLKGHESVLVFVIPGGATSVPYSHLVLAFHALWHRVEGNFYLFCNGSEQECRIFASDTRLDKHGATVLLDAGGKIAGSFSIHTSLEAVELDEDVQVLRYGSPTQGSDLKGDPSQRASQLGLGEITRERGLSADVSSMSHAIASKDRFPIAVTGNGEGNGYR